MRRRQFISLLAGAAAAYPLAARAREGERARRVGVLMSTTAEDVEGQARIDAFLQGLRQAGWAVPGNVRIETRWGAGDAERIRKYAAELLALAPDVILASGGSVVGPLLKLTRTVPIVFTLTPDPVGAGFVQSLAHPGGNATGFTSIEYGMSGKWLELMREIAPGVPRVAVLRDPTLPAGIAQFAILQAAATSLGTELSSIGGRDAAEIEGAVTEFARASNGGLIVLGSAVTVLHRDLIIALAARHALPAVYPGTYFVTSGGLISYSADSTDPHRRAAGYSIASSRATSRPTFRCRTRSSMSWRSISRPQRRSASKFPTGCSRSPTK
jgi:ABC-type uncharacterized transport system substrate-binding protein